MQCFALGGLVRETEMFKENCNPLSLMLANHVVVDDSQTQTFSYSSLLYLFSI